MAVLHSTEESFYGKSFKKISPKEKVDKVVFDFLDSTLQSYERENVRMSGNNAVYFTPDFEVQKKTAF